MRINRGIYNKKILIDLFERNGDQKIYYNFGLKKPPTHW